MKTLRNHIQKELAKSKSNTVTFDLRLDAKLNVNPNGANRIKFKVKKNETSN